LVVAHVSLPQFDVTEVYEEEEKLKAAGPKSKELAVAACKCTTQASMDRN